MIDWHKLQETVLPYVVRIVTQRGSGTGFLFGYNAERSLAAIATAGHVVDDVHDWKQPIKLIHHVSGRETFLTDDEYVIDLDRERDSASILIPADELPFPQRLLPLLDHERFVPVGTELGWLGYPSVADKELCFFTGRVSAFLQSNDCYLIDGVAINGVSGGPVFAAGKNDIPDLVGSISAYRPNQVPGGPFPGLLEAQDVKPFRETLNSLRSLDEARRWGLEEFGRSRSRPRGQRRHQD